MFTVLFWAVVLLATRGNEGRAKIVFGIFMFVSFLLYFSHAVYFQQVENFYLYIDPIYTFATLSVYPLYYWYIRQLTTDRLFDFKNLYLFVPAVVLSSLTGIFYILMDSGERSLYIHQFIFGHGSIETPSTIIKAQVNTYILARISFVIIIIATYFKGRPTVIKYNQKIADHFSNLNKKSIHWVNRMLSLFIITSFLTIALNALGRSFFLDSPYLLAIPSVIFTVLFFSLGYLAFYQKYDISNLDIPTNEIIKVKTISKKNHSLLLNKLNDEFVKKKIYRQQELKITELASIINTNRTYISNLINQEFGCSFNEHVNRYRIAEAKELLNNSEESMEEIATKVGYGSTSTFFRSFKTQVGLTPNRYKMRIRIAQQQAAESPIRTPKTSN